MRLDTAPSGAAAVAMAETTKYDVILMDQRMPEMDGTEALHRIRESSEGESKDSPIVCLTADAVIGAKEKYLAEGFSDYLTKPIDSYALEKMLMKYLPEEKVERVREEEVSEPKKEIPENDFDVLRSAGIEPRTGLLYCQNDEAFYRSVLAEYALGGKEKTENLKQSFDKENWHDYAIYVHALKSTSKMIGASSLSDQAARMETAANNGDAASIRKEHDAMMQKYEEVTRAISTVIPTQENTGDDSDIMEFAPTQEDVLEFLPDPEKKD